MTTVGTMISRTQRHLMGMNRAEFDQLAGAIDDNDTSFTVSHGFPGLGKGSYLGIDDEIIFVWEYNSSTKVAIVQRAMLGTEGAAHDSLSLIEVNPRFPKVMIRDSLREEINSYGPEYYAIATIDADVGVTQTTVNLAGIDDGFYEILRVYRSPTSGTDNWYPIKFHAIADLSRASYSSSVALMIDESFGDTYSIRVVYARPFDTSSFNDTTDVEDTVGLPASGIDIPPIGAAWRMLTTREIKRTQTKAQGEPRLADEVPPGHIIQTAAALQKMRDKRLMDEISGLLNRYPPRFQV